MISILLSCSVCCAPLLTPPRLVGVPICFHILGIGSQRQVRLLVFGRHARSDFFCHFGSGFLYPLGQGLVILGSMNLTLLPLFIFPAARAGLASGSCLPFSADILSRRPTWILIHAQVHGPEEQERTTVFSAHCAGARRYFHFWFSFLVPRFGNLLDLAAVIRFFSLLVL
jgi:hypothetical protein